MRLFEVSERMPRGGPREITYQGRHYLTLAEAEKAIHKQAPTGPVTIREMLSAQRWHSGRAKMAR